MYPEELTLEEMICYIRNADICAIPSGTLPHNYLFAQDGKKVVIVERTALINEMQVDVDRIKNLDVTYIYGHWLVYPGLSRGGPFYMDYTQDFKNFTNALGYSPDKSYVSEKYKKQSLKKCVKIHMAFFAYDWGMVKWVMIYAKPMYEAHEATVQEFFDYIKGIKPFIFKHYFQIHYIRIMIKRLLKKREGKYA